MLTFLVFLNYTSGYLKFCNLFCIFEMAWSLVKDFSKMYILSYFGHFLLQFLLYNCIFLRILKVEHLNFPEH